MFLSPARGRGGRKEDKKTRRQEEKEEMSILARLERR
jgi:hypothetical protein